MSANKDCGTVREEILEEERRTLGQPPTDEKVLDYLQGRLAPEEEALVRDLLVCYPDLARAMTEPFPGEDARPGEPGFVSDIAMAKRWKSIKRTIRARSVASPPPLREMWMWRISTALAAALAIFFGGLLWQAESRATRLAHELRQPQVPFEEYLLHPEGQQRGPGGDMVTLTPGARSYRLDVSLEGTSEYDQFRIEIVDIDATPVRSIWKSGTLHRPDDNFFGIFVPQDSLAPGRYDVVLYGVRGGSEERIASFGARVPRR